MPPKVRRVPGKQAYLRNKERLALHALEEQQGASGGVGDGSGLGAAQSIQSPITGTGLAGLLVQDGSPDLPPLPSLDADRQDSPNATSAQPVASTSAVPYSAVPSISFPTSLDTTASRVTALFTIDQAAEAALTANKAYQSRMLEVMSRLSSASTRMDELQNFLIDAMEDFKRAGGGDTRIVAPGTSTVTLPWFKHFYSHDIAPNPDGEARDLYLGTVHHNPWSAPERAKLKNEVIASNNRHVAMLAQSAGESIADRIAATDPAFFEHSTEHLDWDRIAQIIPRRTAAACRLRWLHHDHPNVNTRKWSEKDLERLYLIAEKHGFKNWKAIAQELNTGRTPSECLRQWRRRTGNKLGWTKEQDEKLKEAIRMHGENWLIVARFVGREPNHCINRWNKTLKPDIRRGRWNADEDKQLREAVAAVGLDWKEAAPRVKGRTDAQCRERWVNLLDPRLLSQKVWSVEEEATIVRMREQEGKTWSEIAAAFDNRRTDNHCLRRYKAIVKRRNQPAKPPKLPKTTRKRKRVKEEDPDDDQVGEPDVDQPAPDASHGGIAAPVAAKTTAMPKRQPKKARTIADEGDAMQQQGGPEAEIAAASGGGDEFDGGVRRSGRVRKSKVILDE